MDDWDTAITFTAKTSGEFHNDITPTATEKVLPWKREEDNDFGQPVKQKEFPAWCSNKDYLTYSSPSTTVLANFYESNMPIYAPNTNSRIKKEGLKDKMSQSLPEYWNKKIRCSLPKSRSKNLTNLTKALLLSHSDSSIDFRYD
ncbi:uncharacterized protein LOC106640001 [Copidosoma floridanum]|uniref:uncharacterized protein LOC106640001 n=1 Tax=Copidosoma floridanum TaxID=29053 RepID=UPI0006C9C5E0|nr:uncharacterized protein LOC106640001 [Copidosoma floridanum]